MSEEHEEEEYTVEKLQSRDDDGELIPLWPKDGVSPWEGFRDIGHYVLPHKRRTFCEWLHHRAFRLHVRRGYKPLRTNGNRKIGARGRNQPEQRNKRSQWYVLGQAIRLWWWLLTCPDGGCSI